MHGKARLREFVKLVISDIHTAQQINELMLDIYRRLEVSLEMVKEHCSSEEHAAYKKAIGKIVARIVFDVIEPLYEQVPGLKPPNWDE